MCVPRGSGAGGGAPGGLKTPDRHPLSPDQATESPARVSGLCRHASFLPCPLTDRPPPVSTCRPRVALPVPCAFPCGAALARRATVSVGLRCRSCPPEAECGVVADMGRWTGRSPLDGKGLGPLQVRRLVSGVLAEAGPNRGPGGRPAAMPRGARATARPGLFSGAHSSSVLPLEWGRPPRPGTVL